MRERAARRIVALVGRVRRGNREATMWSRFAAEFLKLGSQGQGAYPSESEPGVKLSRFRVTTRVRVTSLYARQSSLDQIARLQLRQTVNEARTKEVPADSRNAAQSCLSRKTCGRLKGHEYFSCIVINR